MAARVVVAQMVLWCFALMVMTAQSARQPSFEAATIKLNKSLDSEAATYEHGRLTVHSASLKDLIIAAYDMNFKRDLVQGAPDWITITRFDVLAVTDPKTPDSTSRLMLRTLLAERFKLKVHTEDRPTSVFLLQVAKNGPKLLPPNPNSTYPTGCFSSAPLVCHNVTMATLATALRSNAAGIHISVIDETGIEGRYDLKLEYVLDKNGYGRAEDPVPTPAASDGPTIFNALAQFGLKLQSVRRTMQVLVIDHVEQLLPDN